MSLNVDPTTWNCATAGGIPYKLMESYPKGSVSEEQATTEERYIIQASNLNAFLVESMSVMTVYPGGSWYYRAPRCMPGMSTLYTKSVDFEPFIPGKPADPFNAHGADADTYGQFMLVTIHYGTPDANSPGDQGGDQDLVELSASATGEFLVIPVGPKDYYATAEKKNKNPVAPATKIVPGIEWSVRFPRVPRSSMSAACSAARGLLGRVNSSPMSVLYGAPKETILLVGLSFGTKWTWKDEEPYMQLDIKLIEKAAGHNKFYNPDTSSWEVLYKKDGSKVYDEADLNQLFY
jgi:hypothetical protein